jgi:hypothetical protein
MVAKLNLLYLSLKIELQYVKTIKIAILAMRDKTPKLILALEKIMPKSDSNSF